MSARPTIPILFRDVAGGIETAHSLRTAEDRGTPAGALVDLTGR
jgi:hypothetical protein